MPTLPPQATIKKRMVLSLHPPLRGLGWHTCTAMAPAVAGVERGYRAPASPMPPRRPFSSSSLARAIIPVRLLLTRLYWPLSRGVANLQNKIKQNKKKEDGLNARHVTCGTLWHTPARALTAAHTTHRSDQDRSPSSFYRDRKKEAGENHFAKGTSSISPALGRAVPKFGATVLSAGTGRWQHTISGALIRSASVTNSLLVLRYTIHYFSSKTLWYYMRYPKFEWETSEQSS
ncbi:hypothetical protein F5148DRAFT_1345175 [Russula earlei]|uniref:Uncharacterized protein n=1 Tax=Russula earlei TaxID=71964 RepID=A0ACC0UES8_9AGAM|nr:hypothetical protein F5148DRAFT_1345175 [Russula earlei]